MIIADNDHPFHENEEQSIVSLLIDFPELYQPISKFLTPDLFQNPTAKYVVAQVHNDFERYGIVPSRKLLRARLAKQLTVEDPYEDILQLVERPSDPREIPILKDSLHQWAEHRTFELLYSDEAIAAHQRGDHEFLENIFNEAARIRHTGQQGFWFFKQLDELFVEDNIEHYTTGFSGLNEVMEGGPSPSEVVVWMAPTGVGKSIMLCNQAVTGISTGKNVLLVTFELSTLKTAMRIAANISRVPINDITSNESKVRKLINNRRKGDTGDLVIYELPPDEHSVDTVYSIIDGLKKTKGWTPNIVILDYLELMISRRSRSNDDDYTRQKGIATEVRGLARNEHVLVHTATQTNRQGLRVANQRDEDVGGIIDLEHSAESYGKNMPLDYVISMNQSRSQHALRNIDLFVAKNRNGPKNITVNVNISYDTMKLSEAI